MKPKIVKQNLMYVVIIIILVAAFMFTYLFSNDISLDIKFLFWGSLVWGLATLIAVVYSVHNNWKQQSAILKQEIKVQLFDKRYSVFNALVKAKRFINRGDFNLIVMSNIMNLMDMQKELYNLNEDIKEKADLSQTIFGNKVHDKMLNLSKFYQEIFICFMKLPLKAIEEWKTQNKEHTIEQIYILMKKNYEGNFDLNDIEPNIKAILSEYVAIAEKFNKYYNECGIMDDFDEYLKINDLDRFDDGKFNR